MMPQEHHIPREPEQGHHIIKREMHSEYDDMEQDHHPEGMAEDLTVTPDQHDSNILDA